MCRCVQVCRWGWSVCVGVDVCRGGSGGRVHVWVGVGCKRRCVQVCRWGLGVQA